VNKKEKKKKKKDLLASHEDPQFKDILHELVNLISAKVSPQGESADGAVETPSEVIDTQLIDEFARSALIEYYLCLLTDLEVRYSITIKLGTADIPNTGTKAKVFVKLFGEHGESEEITVQAKNLFQSNTVEQLECKLPLLGNIKRIKIGQKDSAANSFGWYLARVEVQNELSRKKWVFECHRWFDKNVEGDEARLVREFVPVLTEYTYVSASLQAIGQPELDGLVERAITTVKLKNTDKLNELQHACLFILDNNFKAKYNTAV